MEKFVVKSKRTKEPLVLKVPQYGAKAVVADDVEEDIQDDIPFEKYWEEKSSVRSAVREKRKQMEQIPRSIDDWISKTKQKEDDDNDDNDAKKKKDEKDEKVGIVISDET